MKFSELYKNLFNKKYGDVNDYIPSTKTTKHVKYEINFVDDSSLTCVMTNQQRSSLKRSPYWTNIKNISGLGYQTHK